ncbi:MAG: DnaJ domain-containing protein [Candidatus Rokubacteria bacterium]|nr:DnaJ domain-containing protein [Candidatus Rokubacteria bacterium]
MRKRDYYEVLGVRVGASLQEVRRAYRALARQCSPDVNLWDRTAAVLFKEIEEAYRVLCDPTARSLYDRYGHRAFMPSPPPGDRPEPRRGEDLHYTIDLGFEDAVRGLTTAIEVARQTACEACRGRGAQAAGTAAPCPACQGRGIGLRQAVIRVTVPGGVDTGAEIRIPGQGHAGRSGGSPGDLVVTTRVRPHPLFTRKGDNLYGEVPITIPEAVLGARIQIPTPDGPAAMIVPPGTQSGQLFRVRGKGCPHLGRDGRGDLYVAVRVVIPRNLDSGIEELLRALERLLPENPRTGLLDAVGGRA